MRGRPVFLITQHGPSEHSDLSSQCHSCFRFASLLFAADAVVDSLGPFVVSEGSPRALDENRPCQRIAPFGDSSVAVGFAGLILAGYESEIGRDLASVGESMRIVDAGNEDLSRSRTYARDSSNALDAWGILTDGFEFFDHDIKLRSQGIELRQFDI